MGEPNYENYELCVGEFSFINSTSGNYLSIKVDNQIHFDEHAQ